MNLNPFAKKQWTQEEVDQANSDMVDAEMTDAEIDSFWRAQGVLPTSPLLDVSQGPAQARQVAGQLGLFAFPAVGGMYGAQATAGRNALPFLGGAGRAATQFTGEAAGIAGGDVAGRYLAGVPQNLKETSKVALGGAGIGSLLRGAVQVGGAVGGVPESVTQAAAEPMRVGGMPVPVPNLQRVARAGPHNPAQVKAGISPEMDLVERASKAARKLSRTITQARRDKEAIIRLADSRGVRIPIAPIQDALREHIVKDPAEITREARQLNARINATANDLGRAAANSGGTLSPGQVDRLIRQQLRPRVYTSSGQPSHSMYAAPLESAEASATQLLTDSLPGDVAKMNVEISERLSSSENASKIFGNPDKKGVATTIADAFKPNNEQSARALNVLKQHDETIVDDAYDLYVRRQMAGDIREPAMQGQAGFFGTMVRKPVELATRAAAPFQRFAGGAAAGAYEYNKKRIGPSAYEYFKQAFGPTP